MKPEIKQRIEQINNGQVPDGYKKTEFGVFPCDWATNETFGDYVSLKNKKYDPTISLDNPICYELEHINSNVGNVNGNVFGKEQDSIKNIFDVGDVLFGKLRPYLAKFLFAKHAGVCSTEIWVLNSKANLSNKFLYCTVASKSFIDIANQSSFGTKMPRANWTYVSNSKIALPKSINEQEKIAEILMKWDEAIELQEKYIEKLEMCNSIIVKSLFIPKNNWVKTDLGKVLLEKSVFTKVNNQHQVLSSTKNGLVAQSDYFDKQVASEDNIGYKVIRKDEIVISPQNLWLGNINYNDKFEIGIVSPSYKIFEINKEYDKLFISTLMKTPRMLNQYVLSSEQGASVVRRNLNMDLFYSISICIPCFEEQQKISKTIRAIQNNYELEKKKLNATKQQRKALQQYLLSGIVRV